ncbi:MAG: FeoA domain-containing protein [Bacteroidia bacterium]|nr:FeoA domain-containing protein [Bacteroidia bacterium]
MITQRLDKYGVNQMAEISTVVQNSLTAKLTDMGLFSGKKIKVLFRAPLGDPIAVDVEGYILSLRLDEAALIQVTPVE